MNYSTNLTSSFQSQSPDSQPSYLSIPKIRVIVRKRPLSKKESSKGENDIVDIRGTNQIVVKELKTKVDLTKYIEEHSFIFDLAFAENASNEQIYIQTIRPMIEAAFNKTKVTCFAYGQTGSGKTFTMMGNNSKIPGMYLLAAYDIFTLLNMEKYNGFSIWLSFYEIYCGKLYDLLNDRNSLTVREDGKQNICIGGLTQKNVNNLNNLMNLIEKGLIVRTVGVTGANNDSSRSHGIIQIVIKDNFEKNFGKISFIDLAGSERAADTIDTNKQTRFDGAEINKSLLALKECIRALDQEKKHTPFRGSKLTLVLRDSFIGNCKTLMIANISPAGMCSEHTLNTLRYADRVKELRAKPEIKIGEGNVNLNFNGINNNNANGQDEINNLMYMPRNHKNTIKYTVDNSNLKVVGGKRLSKKVRKRNGNNNNINGMKNNNNNGNNDFNKSFNNNSKFNGLFNNFPSICENINNNNINNNINNNNNNNNSFQNYSENNSLMIDNSNNSLMANNINQNIFNNNNNNYNCCRYSSQTITNQTPQFKEIFNNNNINNYAQMNKENIQTSNFINFNNNNNNNNNNLNNGISNNFNYDINNNCIKNQLNLNNNNININNNNNNINSDVLSIKSSSVHLHNNNLNINKIINNNNNNSDTVNFLNDYTSFNQQNHTEKKSSKNSSNNKNLSEEEINTL